MKQLFEDLTTEVVDKKTKFQNALLRLQIESKYLYGFESNLYIIARKSQQQKNKLLYFF